MKSKRTDDKKQNTPSLMTKVQDAFEPVAKSAFRIIAKTASDGLPGTAKLGEWLSSEELLRPLTDEEVRSATRAAIAIEHRAFECFVQFLLDQDVMESIQTGMDLRHLRNMRRRRIERRTPEAFKEVLGKYPALPFKQLTKQLEADGTIESKPHPDPDKKQSVYALVDNARPKADWDWIQEATLRSKISRLRTQSVAPANEIPLRYPKRKK